MNNIVNLCVTLLFIYNNVYMYVSSKNNGISVHMCVYTHTHSHISHVIAASSVVCLWRGHDLQSFEGGLLQCLPVIRMGNVDQGMCTLSQ